MKTKIVTMHPSAYPSAVTVVMFHTGGGAGWCLVTWWGSGGAAHTCRSALSLRNTASTKRSMGSGEGGTGCSILQGKKKK